MKETDRLFFCAYCQVKSCLLPKGVFRYVLAHGTHTEKALVFFPYWRYRGTRFTCTENQIQDQFFDVTHQAVASPYFPVSMGLRAQAMKLAFVSPQTQGRFLEPTLSIQDVFTHPKARFKKELTTGQVYHQSQVGEVLSLIYSPFYIDTQVVDAILNRPVSGPLPANFIGSLPESDPSDWQMRLLSAICPSCGWNLSGERNAAVLTCTNCNSAWLPAGGCLKQIPAGFLPDEKADLFLPFWRINAEVSGIPLSSYADLLHLANLPRIMQMGWDQVAFRFWSLAFKLSPKHFLSLSIRMNLTQPQEKPIPGIPTRSIYPVSLSVTEAIDTLKTSLAGMMKPAETGFPKLPKIHIKALGFSLVYLPFQSGHHEWLQPRYCIAINKKMLSLTDH